MVQFSGFRRGIPARSIRTMELQELVVTGWTGLVLVWNASPWPSPLLSLSLLFCFRPSCELVGSVRTKASEMTGIIPRPSKRGKGGCTRAGLRVGRRANALPFPSQEQDHGVHGPVRKYTLARRCFSCDDHDDAGASIYGAHTFFSLR